MTAGAYLATFRDEPAVRVTAGPTALTGLPALGLLGVSLRHQQGEYLRLHGGPSTFAAGHTTGLPLLAPWANRLAGDRYRAGSTSVDVAGCAGVGRDVNGLPIHGTMLGRRRWELEYVEADTSADVARLAARFRFGEHADLLASFPFPHDLRVEIEIQPGTVQVTTTITPTGRRAVPVSFGWHPYFRLPRVRRRREIMVRLPKRHRLDLDDVMIPTGGERLEVGEEVLLGTRTFDDAYRLGADRSFRISVPESDDHRASSLEIEMGDGYSHAQVYAPAGQSFVAFEPMTAPTNALVSGGHPTVAPGEAYTATFTVRVT